MLYAVLAKLYFTFLSIGSPYSAATLTTSLMIAVLLTLRRRRARAVSPRVMFRAMFPAWWYRHRSFRADVMLMLFNLFGYGLLFGWSLFTSDLISDGVRDGLLTTLGGFPRLLEIGNISQKAIATLMLFLAYEIGYFGQHWMMHRIPFLWEFHKVHHTAEVLSPLTNFRVHPVDTLIFHHVLAISVGSVAGVLSYMADERVTIFTIGSYNILLIVGAFLLVHLQHTHIWIAATGTLGRIIMSPAHHQIHHSTDPKHFNKNFGSCLAIWDWMAGTLYKPSQERERLTFGIEPRREAHHTWIGCLLTPFHDLRHLMVLGRNPRKRR